MTGLDTLRGVTHFFTIHSQRRKEALDIIIDKKKKEESRSEDNPTCYEEEDFVWCLSTLSFLESKGCDFVTNLFEWCSYYPMNLFYGAHHWKKLAPVGQRELSPSLIQVLWSLHVDQPVLTSHCYELSCLQMVPSPKQSVLHVFGVSPLSTTWTEKNFVSIDVNTGKFLSNRFPDAPTIPIHHGSVRENRGAVLMERGPLSIFMDPENRLNFAFHSKTRVSYHLEKLAQEFLSSQEIIFEKVSFIDFSLFQNDQNPYLVIRFQHDQNTRFPFVHYALAFVSLSFSEKEIPSAEFSFLALGFGESVRAPNFLHRHSNQFLLPVDCGRQEHSIFVFEEGKIKRKFEGMRLRKVFQDIMFATDKEGSTFLVHLKGEVSAWNLALLVDSTLSFCEAYSLNQEGGKKHFLLTFSGKKRFSLQSLTVDFSNKPKLEIKEVSSKTAPAESDFQFLTKTHFNQDTKNFILCHPRKFSVDDKEKEVETFAHLLKWEGNSYKYEKLCVPGIVYGVILLEESFLTCLTNIKQRFSYHSIYQFDLTGKLLKMLPQRGWTYQEAYFDLQYFFIFHDKLVFVNYPSYDRGSDVVCIKI